MCETRVNGIVPGWAAGRGQRRAAAQAECGCRQPAAALSSTQYAQRVLAVCGGIVVLASAGAILRGLLIAVAVAVVLAAAAAGWWLSRRMRSPGQEQYVIPAPIGQAPRTTVTGVQVRSLEPGQRPAAAPAASNLGMAKLPPPRGG